jgi:hypothetical protein
VLASPWLSVLDGDGDGDGDADAIGNAFTSEPSYRPISGTG